MIKKFLCILFSLFMVLNTFAADKFQVGDLYYSIIAESEVQVVAQDITNNYPGLINCTIPESITSQNITYKVTGIAYNAFNSAKDLSFIHIPKTITKIENEANDKGTRLEWNAFYNTPKLARIEVDKGNPNYTDEYGVLFNKSKSMLIVYPKTKTEDLYIIPDGVERIDAYAFWQCSFTEIILPSSLKMLGMMAFYECKNLRKITCYAIEPPKESVGWGFVNTKQETLYVPKGSLETYKADNLWQTFLPNIFEISMVYLDEKNKNTLQQLDGLKGQIVDVELNRSFDTDGAWYTLCLPFSLTEQQIAESLGEGCALMKLDYAQLRSSEDLYVHFASATTLEAGIPYLFKPANALTPPIFKGVVIEYQTDKENTIATPDKLVSMTGIYAPTQVPADKWYLGPDNTLYQPQGKVISKGFRAYFSLSTSLPSKIRARVVMNNELPTDIDDIQVDTDVLPQKVLENGQVYIFRGGHKYNLQGQVVE